MRWGSVLLLGVTLVGCASIPQPQPAAVASVASVYDDAVAAALVYDPPVVVNSPKFDVSREGRGPAAYAGFDEVIATSYYLRIDDRQLGYGDWHGHSHNNDRFERQAITERVGVSYR